MKRKYSLIGLLMLFAMLITACGGDAAGEEPSEDTSTTQESEEIISLAKLSPAERGELWATEFNCIGCHSTDGSAITGGGPTWLNIYGSEELLDDGTTAVVDDAYIVKSVIEPGFQTVDGFIKGIMPDNLEGRFEHKEKQLLENEGLEIDVMSDLIAYIQTITE